MVSNLIKIDSTDFLQASHFDVCPMWSFEEEEGVYYPVTSPDELPEDVKDLRVKVELFTSSGLTLKGYISGVNSVFSIGVFVGNKNFHFNKNLSEPSLEELDSLISELSSPQLKTKEDFFPVRYETRFNFEGYRNFQGEFDMFE